MLTAQARLKSKKILTISLKRSISPCHSCGEEFSVGNQWGKLWHAKKTQHLPFACKFVGCNRAFAAGTERDAHQKRPHVSGHGRVTTATPDDCIECEESFFSKAELLRHATEQQHQPYGCECGSLFSRLDVLNRHLETFDLNDPKYHNYCKRHRGPDGFRRLDHLRQHIRNYHHLEADKGSKPGSRLRLKYAFPVCSHPGCQFYRDETFKELPRGLQAQRKPFHSQSAYTKHMRDEHNECPFPCDVLGCHRVGRKGYFREKDLLSHRREHHPDAVPYQITKREVRIQCTEPNCNALLDASSLHDHLQYRHQWWKKSLEETANSGPSLPSEESNLSTTPAALNNPMQSMTDFHVPETTFEGEAMFNF